MTIKVNIESGYFNYFLNFFLNFCMVNPDFIFIVFDWNSLINKQVLNDESEGAGFVND